MLYERGWFGQGGAGMGRGRGYGTDTGYGRGMGFGGGRGFGRGMGMGRGNPYPFCRFDPSLPRRWWASGGGLYPPAPWRSYGRQPAWGAGPYEVSMTIEDELESLREEANVIKAHLNEVEARTRTLQDEQE